MDDLLELDEQVLTFDIADEVAFDLLELDGRDLRRRPIEERKALLTKLGVEN